MEGDILNDALSDRRSEAIKAFLVEGYADQFIVSGAELPRARPQVIEHDDVGRTTFDNGLLALLVTIFLSFAGFHRLCRWYNGKPFHLGEQQASAAHTPNEMDAANKECPSTQRSSTGGQQPFHSQISLRLSADDAQPSQTNCKSFPVQEAKLKSPSSTKENSTDPPSEIPDLLPERIASTAGQSLQDLDKAHDNNTAPCCKNSAVALTSPLDPMGAVDQDDARVFESTIIYNESNHVDNKERECSAILLSASEYRDILKEKGLRCDPNQLDMISLQLAMERLKLNEQRHDTIKLEALRYRYDIRQHHIDRMMATQQHNENMEALREDKNWLAELERARSQCINELLTTIYRSCAVAFIWMAYHWAGYWRQSNFSSLLMRFENWAFTCPSSISVMATSVSYSMEGGRTLTDFESSDRLSWFNTNFWASYISTSLLYIVSIFGSGVCVILNCTFAILSLGMLMSLSRNLGLPVVPIVSLSMVCVFEEVAVLLKRASISISVVYAICWCLLQWMYHRCRRQLEAEKAPSCSMVRMLLRCFDRVRWIVQLVPISLISVALVDVLRQNNNILKLQF